eukprot:TRINITY_DN731_c1_g1_i1.p1 TRINITY_DN731_c1_g1~~TRINITY_DN731_c1_g1_i1.p1  ORF type:complete len:155 (-),score=23.18 TRINITY_DN731_c1_g1_i1:597-998(-)
MTSKTTTTSTSSASRAVERLTLLKIDSNVDRTVVEDMLNRVRSLKNKFRTIQCISIGVQNMNAFSGYIDLSRGYTHSIRVRFDNSAALKLYLEDPDVKNIATDYFDKCLLEPPLVLDYLVDESAPSEIILGGS